MKRNFPQTGLVYFWFLNDDCRREHIDRQIEAFAAGGVSTVCLHPRDGLLLPYGGDDWFEFIAETAKRCAKAGLKVWLYDEDPYPSGNAGGWITSENPGYVARAIECFEADPGLGQDDLFCFPAGKLLWAGCVQEHEHERDRHRRPAIDLTGKVGVLRRKWNVRESGDSRRFYPATPLYPCPRSRTYGMEFALRIPAIPAGMKLVAFIARAPKQDPKSPWGALPDSLNPEVTRLFIQKTHERYAQVLGEMFGKEITAIFTDEPKYYGGRPWTGGLFEDFAQCHGYDLRPRLYDLFSDSQQPDAVLARLHYRQWCGKRFEEAWLEPVGQWCRAHHLALVGHISPEDDPVQQANCVSNLFPLYKHFDLPGLDLIIPAVGDEDHPLINIGVTAAVSAAQQQDQPGVMSESLACSGLDFTADEAEKILNWQTVMGMTTPVIHAAFSSTEGPRLLDAPPDFGPRSPRWAGMCRIGRALRPIQEKLIGATQIAPVAILWPIRSFQAVTAAWQAEPGGLRGDLCGLLLACLEKQIGVHLIDEEDLYGVEAAACDLPDNSGLRLGRARYTRILIPSCTVLHEKTAGRLKVMHEMGIEIYSAGEIPSRQQTESGITALDLTWCPRGTIAEVVGQLPSLIDVAHEARKNLRCTSWKKAGEVFSLLINIGDREIRVPIDGVEMTLPAGKIQCLAV